MGEDRFDGGCPADVGTDTKAEADPFMDTVKRYGDNRASLGFAEGYNHAARMLIDTHPEAAQVLIESFHAEVAKRDEKPA
jgi:hypothetical protein